jgi:hypothetical protein
MANLLEICQRAIDEIGSFNNPTFIVGNDDDTARQLLAIAKKVGEELTRDYDWEQLDATGTITTVNGTATYDVEDDFERLMSDTLWDADNRRRIWGSLSRRSWAAVRNLSTTTSGYFWFRVAGGQIELSPTPTSAIDLNYAYQSAYYCTTSGGTPIAAWATDTDLPRLPADLFIAGIKFYFAKANNLPYGDHEAEYDGVIQSRQGKNLAVGSVDMGAGNYDPTGCVRRLNIPDRVDF